MLRLEDTRAVHEPELAGTEASHQCPSEHRNPDPMNDPVDVLIIGAGASGAAFAWGLADTRMRILCLDQGDWVNPSEYPATRRDWELRADADFSPDPNVRRRREDYPVNNDDSPISVLNFNGVGGGTILYAAHFPRLHPSDFRARSLDGVADDWPIGYSTLEPWYAVNDHHMGVAGLAGDPAYPPHQPPLPPPRPRLRQRYRPRRPNGPTSSRYSIPAIRPGCWCPRPWSS